MRLTSLFVYPIKACGGVGVAEATVTRRGLRGDRRFMLVDATGKFVTQRERPELSQLRCAIEGERLHLVAGDKEPIDIPLRLDDGPRVEVHVWRDRCSALLQLEASAWVGEAVGADLRVVYMPDDTERPVAGTSDIVSFADGYPFLLGSESSLDDLNRRLETPITMERFRPNLVVDGEHPFAEDGWETLRIGEARFAVTKGCDRCSVTTVDPKTGSVGKEPLRTLATFRRRDKKVWFGVNLVAVQLGRIRVGDPVWLE